MQNDTVRRLSDEEVVKVKTKLEGLQEDLKHSREAKGFRKLTKKNEQSLSNKIQETAKELADEYLARYEELCKLCGMEIRAVMRVNDFNPNIAQAVTELKPYNPAPKENFKPWHEAMADNLRTRAKCEHVEHAEGLICEKCGLAKTAWGVNNKGVNQDYFKEQTERIKAEKETYEQAKREEEGA